MSKDYGFDSTEKLIAWAINECPKYLFDQRMSFQDWHRGGDLIHTATGAVAEIERDENDPLYDQLYIILNDGSREVVKREDCKYVQDIQYDLVWGGSWRNSYIHLPKEVGEALAKVWHQNKYHQFTNTKTFKSIMKLIGANVEDAEKRIAEGEALAAKNQRNYHRDQAIELIQRFEKELVGFNDVTPDITPALTELNELIAKIAARREE